MPKSDTNEPVGPDLDRLHSDRDPPDALEDRVVEALRAEGALRTDGELRSEGSEGSIRSVGSKGRPGAEVVGAAGEHRIPRRYRMGLIAAGIALFIAGSLVGRAMARTTGPLAATTGQPFMLLLWEDDRFSAGSPDAVAEEYAAWAEQVARSGSPISGDELGPSRTIGGSVGGAGPASDARIGGYFLVHAENAEAADRLARDHPHVGHGGWIDVAPILQR